MFELVIYVTHKQTTKKVHTNSQQTKKKVAAGDKGCGCWPLFHFLIPENEKDTAANS